MTATSEAGQPLRAGWVIFALAMGGFAIGTTEFASMSLLPYFARDLGLSAPVAGHAISAYALGVVVGAPVIAVVAAAVPRKMLLIALMTLFAIGNGASALAPNYMTLIVFRFISGLPHGAYFGIAALVAVSMVAPNKRSQAFSLVILGLSIATIIGVPLANWIGQVLGWRWGFVLVALCAVTTVVLVYRLVPRGGKQSGSSPLRELSALTNLQVWLNFAVAAIGNGGMFAVYTYLASTLIHVTKVPDSVIPLVLCVFGVGLTVGNLIGGFAADRMPLKAPIVLLCWQIVVLCIYPFVAGNVWAISTVGFLIGIGAGLGPMLQTRLMDVAGDAQVLGAALNQSAFNVANALGPWLGGLAIAAGFGWPSTGFVGAALAAVGLAFWMVSISLQRRDEHRALLTAAAKH